MQLPQLIRLLCLLRLQVCQKILNTILNNALLPMIFFIERSGAAPVHCWSKDFDLATRHRHIGNCWKHAWYINNGLIWHETKVHRYLSADIICSEIFAVFRTSFLITVFQTPFLITVFRTRSSRKTVSFEEHMIIRAYFRAKWRLLNCLWTVVEIFCNELGEKKYKHLTVCWVKCSLLSSKVRLNE